MTKPKSRALIMIVCAVLLAAAAIFLTKSWIQNQVQPGSGVENTSQIETTKVVVASTRLTNGNKLQKVHLSVVDWPVSIVPEDSFATIEEILGNDDQTEERIVLRSIEVNEPILKSRITGFGGRASLSALIAPGMRASTIRVNDVNGVGGFVLPGDHVDVMFTRNSDIGNASGSNNRKKNLQTDVLLQNMKVLAIDQDSNEARDKPSVSKSITLEVTPTQAQKLTLAMQMGKLSLALRNVNTVDAEAVRSIRARDLGFTEANVAPTPKVDKAPEVAEAPKVTKPTHAHSNNIVVKRITPDVVTTVKKAHVVNIVRGIKKTEYEVTQEKPSFSDPALSKPLNLLPTTLRIVAPTKPSLEPMSLEPMSLVPSLEPMSLVSCSGDFDSSENCM